MSGTAEVYVALKAHAIAAAPGAALPTTKYPAGSGDYAGKPKYVQYQGLLFKAPTNERWYRITCLPGEPAAAGIGESAANRHVGIFQIDIFDPAGNGDGATIAEAERIAACYKRDTVLVYSGVTVRCVKAYRSAGNSDDPAWFMVSVVVRWTADVAN